MPKRIQLRRTKGWRKPDGAIVVARPSRWGNPFRVTPFMGGWSVDDESEHFDVYESQRAARRRAVELFEQAIGTFACYEISDADLRELRGRDLACWYPLDQPCHGDVLLERAANL